MGRQEVVIFTDKPGPGWLWVAGGVDFTKWDRNSQVRDGYGQKRGGNGGRRSRTQQPDIHPSGCTPSLRVLLASPASQHSAVKAVGPVRRNTNTGTGTGTS